VSLVGRTIARILPLLEASGHDTMRMPDPGRKHRRSLDEVLREVPQLAVLIDSFEQRVQRPQASKDSKTSKAKTTDRYYSGKKKQRTLKSQVTVNEQDGTFVDISASVPGPTADITLLEDSGVLQRLPQGVSALGDLAYLGMDTLHPQGLAATPRRKPRGQERPPQDIEYNQAFARRRVLVENSIGRLRRYESLNQMDRHHRHNHQMRVVVVAGLVNHQIRHHLPCAA
jgi:DDE superfamily endonuclease